MGPGASADVGRWSRWDRCRSRPATRFPARSRAGIQAFSRESPDAKSRGGMPPAPPVLKPLAARSFCFGVGWRSGAIVGLLRHPCTCPDLETFFHKNAFQHIFPRKCVPNRFWDTVSNSPSTGTMCPTAPKRASGNERAIKPGVQGACPRPSFSPFLGRNGDPRRAGGATGRCAPRATSEPPTQRVLTTGNGLFAPSTPQIVNDIFE